MIASDRLLLESSRISLVRSIVQLVSVMKSGFEVLATRIYILMTECVV